MEGAGISGAIRFDQLIVKLMCSALEASADYKYAIAEAQSAGLQNVVDFLMHAQNQDRERVQQAMEVIGGFFTTRFW